MNSARDDGIIHPAGFPHSGIAGSKPACGSPTLFAAYHALLRLSVPRHPPCALIRLTGSSFSDTRTRAFQPRMLLLFPLFSCFLFPLPSLSIQSRPERARVPTKMFDSWTAFCFPTPAGWRPTRLSRKEVIQPQVPLRLPCYDFAPVIELAFDRCLPEGLAHGLRALPTSMA